MRASLAAWFQDRCSVHSRREKKRRCPGGGRPRHRRIAATQNVGGGRPTSSLGAADNFITNQIICRPVPTASFRRNRVLFPFFPAAPIARIVRRGPAVPVAGRQAPAAPRAELPGAANPCRTPRRLARSVRARGSGPAGAFVRECRLSSRPNARPGGGPRRPIGPPSLTHNVNCSPTWCRRRGRHSNCRCGP